MRQTSLDDHSILVAFLTGDNFSARTNWQPGFAENSASTAERMVAALLTARSKNSLFLVADGINGNGAQLCAALPAGDYKISGCRAGGSLGQSKTYQLGDKQAGSNSLASIAITGNLVMGVGAAHGWEPVGALMKVTSAQGHIIQTINDLPAAEFYSELFQFPPGDWILPPLNEMVRLYPLGIGGGDPGAFSVRSPLCMQPDGALKMNTSISPGSTAHLLLGSITNCLQSAKKAASQALKDLGKARPVLAILLPDVSWQMFFKTSPGQEILAVQEVLGPELPIIGGYTYGQIAGLQDASTWSAPEFLNQHIEVILLGEKG
jgi:hypothetical protein